MTTRDLEDVVYGGAKMRNIQKNMSEYRVMVRDIMGWCVVHRDFKNGQIDIRNAFNKFYGQLSRKYRIFIKKSLLVWVYRQMVEEGEIVDSSGGLFLRLLQKAPSRNLSGDTVVTVLTSPYPDGQDFSCKHNCYYCPNEPGQPRSYLADEPAVARANRNDFDAMAQMRDRLSGLMMNGHEIDKVEIIIEGGTYTEYPIDYLEIFTGICCMLRIRGVVKKEMFENHLVFWKNGKLMKPQGFMLLACVLKPVPMPLMRIGLGG